MNTPVRKYPELWAMRHVEGLSFGEIAKRTGLTRNTAQGRIVRMEQEDPQPTLALSPRSAWRAGQPVSAGLLRLAAFDPLARTLVEARAPQLLP